MSEDNLEDFYSYLWHRKWPNDVLNDPTLASRRKRSHNLKMISLDKEKLMAVFQSGNRDARIMNNVYVTTLTDCTCRDFRLGHGERPCKHIFRLAEELGLFQSEHFSDGEYDYTLVDGTVREYEPPRVREKPLLTKELLEDWKERLCTCRSIYKAFKFLEGLELKKSQLMDFAQYLGVAMCKYDDKHGMISKIVYATVGEKLKDNPVRKRNVEQYERNNLVYRNDGTVEATFVIFFVDKTMERPSFLPSYAQMEKWKGQLLQCRSEYEGIKLIRELKLTIPAIRELADYMGISLTGCQYLKSEIIKWLVNGAIKRGKFLNG